jgi:hypothetical protein
VARGREVVLSLDHPRREAVGEQVSESAMALVELLRVAAVQPLEPARELVSRGVEHEVVVRRHEAERVHRPAEPLDAPAKVSEELPAVGVVAKDVAAAGTPRDDVEVPVRERRAENPGHDVDESRRAVDAAPMWKNFNALGTSAPSVADVSRV